MIKIRIAATFPTAIRSHHTLLRLTQNAFHFIISAQKQCNHLVEESTLL
jgi:hypothetical protein